MEISRDGARWGEMQLEETECEVCFHGAGALPKYGEVLRVWGLRPGAQPLLIGVAEPEGDGLAVNKRLSRQYLRTLGYERLPERYIAGVRPPAGAPREQSADAGICRLLRDNAVNTAAEDGLWHFSCPFASDQEFPLAFVFSFCQVREGRATLLWDEKRDCPVRAVPKKQRGGA